MSPETVERDEIDPADAMNEPFLRETNRMKLASKSGAAVAAAAAALLLSGAASITTASAADSQVKCYGVNSCKGHSACKTANSSCKGQNACKGQGFVLESSADCTAKGGKLEDPNA